MNDWPVIGIRAPGSLTLLQTLLWQGVTVRIRVSGGSMQPLLKGGEVIEVEPLSDKKLHLGDIVFLCDRQGNPLVHRLIWQRLQNGKLHLLTKGDACEGFDGFVPVDNVLGQVRQIIPDSGPSVNLKAPLQRVQGLVIVSKTLITFFGRRGVKFFLNIFLQLFKIFV